MDGRKLALYIMLISATAAVLYQTPMIQAIGRGQHTFESGMNQSAKNTINSRNKALVYYRAKRFFGK